MMGRISAEDGWRW